jgi:tetratricopeptide (TPR) repeat protein
VALDEVRAMQRQRALAMLANPKDADDLARAHLVLGALAEHQHDWDGAIAHYRMVLGEMPQDPDLRYYGHNNLGFSLIQLGRFDEAEPCCLAAIEVEPRRHNAYKNLGLAYIGQGRWLDGALVLLEASQRNPADPRAWRHLEKLLAAKHGLLEQSEDLRRAVAEMGQAIKAGQITHIH